MKISLTSKMIDIQQLNESKVSKNAICNRTVTFQEIVVTGISGKYPGIRYLFLFQNQSNLIFTNIFIITESDNIEEFANILYENKDVVIEDESRFPAGKI